MTLNGMPRKEDMSKVEREIAKLWDKVNDTKDDIKDVKTDIYNMRNSHEQYESAVNKDIGSLKGSCKYCEDQINMVKKMI